MEKTNQQNHSWINKLINFLGYFFLILGIYALTKTSFNYIYYKNKYPLSPAISLNPFYYYQTEEDCQQQFNYPVYDEKGNPKEPTSAEKKIQEKNIKNCLEKVKRQREENKINDLWTAIFLLTLGIGIHLTKRFYLR